MMLASGSTSSRMRVAASSTSNRVRSAAGDRDEEALGALQRRLVEQRIGDRLLGGLDGAPLAGSFARAHHRLAHLAHHGADVGKVEIDQAFLDDEVDDAGDARIEHLVGHDKGLGEGRLLVGDAEEVLVGNDDQGVDAGLQLADALLGNAHAASAFELEGLGDHADGEDPLVAGGAGDDRRRARAGAAAHAGGDEHHVRAVQVIGDLVDRFFGGGAADLRLGAGTETFGDRDAHLDEPFGARGRKRLAVGIGDHELAAQEARADHVVDGVAPGAAHAEHGDFRPEFLDFRHFQIDRHDTLVVFTALGPLA